MAASSAWVDPEASTHPVGMKGRCPGRRPRCADRASGPAATATPHRCRPRRARRRGRAGPAPARPSCRSVRARTPPPWWGRRRRSRCVRPRGTPPTGVRSAPTIDAGRCRRPRPGGPRGPRTIRRRRRRRTVRARCAAGRSAGVHARTDRTTPQPSMETGTTRLPSQVGSTPSPRASTRPDRLMAENDRGRYPFVAGVMAPGVHVAAAQAAGLGANPHLAGRRFRLGRPHRG